MENIHKELNTHQASQKYRREEQILAERDQRNISKKFLIQRLTEEYYRFYKLKNRKKNRRLAIEIEKNFTCPYENCHKVYGSDVSLNLHIKLKHNGGNKTDR